MPTPLSWRSFGPPRVRKQAVGAHAEDRPGNQHSGLRGVAWRLTGMDTQTTKSKRSKYLSSKRQLQQHHTNSCGVGLGLQAMAAHAEAPRSTTVWNEGKYNATEAWVRTEAMGAAGMEVPNDAQVNALNQKRHEDCLCWASFSVQERCQLYECPHRLGLAPGVGLAGPVGRPPVPSCC